MLQGTLRASRSRFTSVSAPLLRIDERDSDVEAGRSESGYPSSSSQQQQQQPRRLARLKRRGTQGLIPLGGAFAVLLALFLSLLFTFTISLAFANANESLYFKNTLDDTAKFDPGVVLIGEAVDVDIDELETAVTIRWTVAGCGEGYVLSGSPPLHGSTSCGVLAVPIKVFIEDSDDNNNDMEFDPSAIPREPVTNRLLMIQTLMQFESEHDLDVHTARFYPFDSYLLTTSIRVEDGSDNTLRVSATPIIKHATSFVLHTTVRQGIVITDDDSDDNDNGNSTTDTAPVRHLEVHVSRPGPARAYAMLLFGINWLLAHCAVGVVVLVKKHKVYRGGREEVLLEALKHIAVVFGILLAMPQLRAVMPDAPEFHGALIDTIGYFPQMSMVGLSLVLILLVTASRLLDAPPRQRTSSSSRLSSFTISTPKLAQKSTTYPDDGDSATIVEGKESYRSSPEKDTIWHRDSSEHEQRSREVPQSGPWRSRPDNEAYLARKQY